jgi:malate permease and related proteins
MSNILTILTQIIFPIFLLIGIGALSDRYFTLNLPTLTKLIFYIFVPAFAFVKVLDSPLTLHEMLGIGVFILVHGAALYLISWLIFSFGPYKSQRTLLTLSVLLPNVGNFGLPLSLLAFGDAAMGVEAVLILIQTVLTFTFGIWLMQPETQDFRVVLRVMLKTPVLYALGTAIVMRGLEWKLPKPIDIPLNQLSNGMVALALLTLGIQLARSRAQSHVGTMATSGVMRLLISPALAYLLARLFGYPPLMVAILVVTAGFPAAVNVYILATEYHRDEELASQIIFWTTLGSAVTLSAIIAIFMGNR